MSGEIVLLPLAPVAFGAVAGAALTAVAVVAVGSVTIAAGGALALGLKSVIDKRVSSAAEEAKTKEKEIKEWWDYQEQSARKMSALWENHSALLAAQQELLKAGLNERRKDVVGTGPTATGYFTLGLDRAIAAREAADGMLKEINEILAGIPHALASEADSPVPNLLAMTEKLQRKAQSDAPPSLETIEAFRRTVQDTIRTYAQTCEKRQQTTQSLMPRLEKLILEAGTWQRLAATRELASGMSSLLSNLKVLLLKGRISLAQVETMEKRLATLRTKIEAKLAENAYRTALAESLARNLGSMGYRAVSDFAEDREGREMRAELAIPGGEALRVGVTSDNRLTFKVVHTMVPGEKDMSAGQKKMYRAQEKKWCQDMRTLLRILAKEGFTYGILDEKTIPDNIIPKAVLEDVEGILARRDEEQRWAIEGDEADEMRRRVVLDQKTQEREA
ncbi:MAG: hypothetical protein C4575_10415 [Desulforudis sp.]|jgi:hypothetical protein|nr:MAG: hypothetical protein C4575_10415 [Desulforudis sp.]